MNKTIIWRGLFKLALLVSLSLGTSNYGWVKKAYAQMAAASGDSLTIGSTLDASSSMSATGITTSNSSYGFMASNSSSGVGLKGVSVDGVGVYAVSSKSVGAQMSSGTSGRGQMRMISDDPSNRSSTCSVGEMRAEYQYSKSGMPAAYNLLYCALPNTWMKVYLTNP